jgi:hypothetical protein
LVLAYTRRAARRLVPLLDGDPPDATMIVLAYGGVWAIIGITKKSARQKLKKDRWKIRTWTPHPNRLRKINRRRQRHPYWKPCQFNRFYI